MLWDGGGRISGPRFCSYDHREYDVEVWIRGIDHDSRKLNQVNPAALRYTVETQKETQLMQLRQFSVSLTVKDIKASRSFYEKLGFEAIDGKPDEGWIILKNDCAVIGLFQGMFDKNIMTFNPRDVANRSWPNC